MTHQIKLFINQHDRHRNYLAAPFYNVVINPTINRHYHPSHGCDINIAMSSSTNSLVSQPETRVRFPKSTSFHSLPLRHEMLCMYTWMVCKFFHGRRKKSNIFIRTISVIDFSFTSHRRGRVEGGREGLTCLYVLA